MKFLQLINYKMPNDIYLIFFFFFGHRQFIPKVLNPFRLEELFEKEHF